MRLGTLVVFWLMTLLASLTAMRGAVLAEAVTPVSQWREPAAPDGPSSDPFVRPVTLETQPEPIYIDALEPPGDDAPDWRTAVKSKLPPGTRAGVFQRLTVQGTWLPQLASDGLGISELATSVMLGFPFLQRETPLLVTPYFAVKYFDRPTIPDLPPRVFDTSIEFRHLRKLNERWAMDVSVNLGVYSDFEQDHSRAFRVTGRGLAVYSTSPMTKWVLGVVYLNRAGATVVPAAGVIYRPDDSVSWELIFPRPRVAWRLPWSNAVGRDERWLYLGGEFGGGVWAIERPSTGLEDVVTSRDFRFVAGLERRIVGGLSRTFEVGYVFGRELEFRSGTPDYEPADTLLVRVGIKY